MTNATPADTARKIGQRIADELGCEELQVAAAVELLDGGATVPFIARYRKEITGSLDDAQLRTLEERLRYLREMEERRASISSPSGRRASSTMHSSARSWRPTRRPGSRTSTCRTSRSGGPRRRSPARPGWSRWPMRCSATRRSTRPTTALDYVDAEKGVPDGAAALEGARAILVERFAEDADLIGSLRERMWTRGRLVATVRDGQGGGGRQVRRLLRLLRAIHRSSPRTGSWPCSGARRRRSSTSPWSLSRHLPSLQQARPPGRASTSARSRYASASPTAAGPPTNGCSTRSAGPGAPGSLPTSASTCGCACFRPPRMRRSGSSRPTCATCYSPRQPEPAPRWVWTPDSAPV